jgi:hypothetical protein
VTFPLPAEEISPSDWLFAHLFVDQRRRIPVAHESVEVAHNRKSAPARATRQKRRRSDDDDQAGPPKRGLAGLLDSVTANGGVIELSQRKLARQLGQSRTTLQRAMRELAAAGTLILDTSSVGTRVALA